MGYINHLYLYVILLVFIQLCFTPPLAYRAIANSRQELTCITLLHLLLRGTILRNSARPVQNLVYLVKNLLITSNLKPLLVYGSPYIKKLLVPLPRIYVLAVSPQGSMNTINQSFRGFFYHIQSFFVGL